MYAPLPAMLLLGLIFVLGLVVGFRALRKPRRPSLSSGELRCPCGYPFAGVTTGVCPECGLPHDHTAAAPDPRVGRLVFWTCGAVLTGVSASLALPGLTPPIYIASSTMQLNSVAGTITFNWSTFDHQLHPRVDAITVTSSRASAPVITLTPADLPATPKGPAPRVDAALGLLLDAAPNLEPAARDAIAADLRTIALKALQGAQPSVPNQGSGFYGSGSYFSGGGAAGGSLPRYPIWPISALVIVAWFLGVLRIRGSAHTEP